MTVSTTTLRNDYTGNGSSTAFTVGFAFQDNSHLKVILTQISTGVPTTLALNSDYTVSGAGSPSGGTVTMVAAPTTDQKVSIIRNIPYLQQTHYVPNDPFPAASHENALDLLTMEVQQLAEQNLRAVTLPENASGVSATLPAPQSNRLLAWNATGTSLQNVDMAGLATIVAFGTTFADVFTGTGAQTAFTLSANPGAQSNLDVSVGGVTQLPSVDYVWSSGTTLTFTSAPPNGAKVLVRYMQGLPQGYSDAASVNYTPSGLLGSRSTSVAAMLANRPIDPVAMFGVVTGSVSATQRTLNTSGLNQAIISAKTARLAVMLPAGRVEFDGTLNAQNGVNVFGHGNMGEGSVPDWGATTLAYYGSGLALNMKGASTSVDTRIQCRWSDFVLDGINSTGSARAVDIGWNQRAEPLLANATIKNFPHYGLNFADQNWNVSFDNVRVDACGITVAGSSGIYKTPSVDSGTFNGIVFNNLQVEGCGTSTSAAGGINLQSTTAGNRGLYFNNCIIEGNLGTREVYITNTADVEFPNFYNERLAASTQTVGVEISGGSANFRGGYLGAESKTHDMNGASGQKVLTFTGPAQVFDAQVGMLAIGAGIAAGSRVASVQAGVGFTLDTNTTGTLSTTSVRYGFPQYGIKATNGAVVSIDGTSITGWLGAMVRSEVTSYVYTKNLQAGYPNPVGYSGDSTAQWIGDYAPRFRVEKGGTNQTGIVDSTFTKITWPTTIFDVTGAVASDKFTPGTLGRYRLNASALFSGIPDTSQLLIAIYKNGGAYSVNGHQSSSSGNANTSVAISTDVDVTATTDYFEVYIRCVAPGAPATTVSGAAGYTRFEGFRLQ